MKVDTKILRDSLAKVGTAIPDKSEIPILTCVLFEAQENSLSLTGFNMVISVSTMITVDATNESYVIGVPYKLLKNIIANLSGTLELTYKASQLHISSQQGKFKISIIPGEEYPELIGAEEKLTFHKLDWESMAPSLKITANIASDDTSKQILTAVCFNGTQKIDPKTEEVLDTTKELVSTDSHRLIVAKLENTLPSELLVVSREIIYAALHAFKKEEIVLFAIAKTVVIFKTDTTEVIGFTVTGKYPPYDQLLPQKFSHTLAVNRDALLLALAVVSPIEEDQYGCKVVLTHHDDYLYLTTNAPDIGQATAKTECEGSTPELKLKLSLRYLKEGVTCMGEEIKINYNKNDTPIVLKDNKIKYLLMPIEG